ncbi:MAG: polysaccharide biosynthesis/export family protein [Bacteroidota bacterium]
MFQSLLIGMVFLSAFMMPSCSSTAVKGTPVKEAITLDDRISFRKLSTKAEREEIGGMSEVSENSVFTVVSGMPEYRIGPLDVLVIVSRIGEKETGTTVTVNNRGNISYSFLDDLHVAGLTPSQLDDLLTQKLLNYIKNPRIDILVKEFKSKSAMVLGEFAFLRGGAGTRAESGKIYLQGKNSLMDLIALAGGFTEDADIKNTTLLRGERPTGLTCSTS